MDAKLQTDQLLRPDLEKSFVRHLFLNSPIGIYIVEKGKFKFVNPEFQKITGYSEQELRGMESLTLVHPDDRTAVRDKAIEMLKGKSTVPYQARIIDRQGKLKWIIETICSIKYYGVKAALGYFMDITEQAKTKEALRMSEEKFHKVFRASPDWLVISTLDEGIYLEVNEAFIQTTGFTQEEVIGHSSKELGIWVDPNERDALHQFLKDSGRICNAEVRFKTKSGQILHVLWSAEVIDYGGQKCLIAVTRDITDRKIAEQELLRREKLQGVLEMAGATCHEMNQPLQNIYFMLEDLLAEQPENKICKSLVEQVKRIKLITTKLENITSYETKDYIQGTKIIDIDRASSCPI